METIIVNMETVLNRNKGIMTKYIKVKSLIITLTFTLSSLSIANAGESNIPEPFRGSDESSKLEINYDDLDMLLQSSVLVTGKSSRAVAKSSKATVGTRMKSSINKLTGLEGNRFHFEAFKDEKYQNLFSNIRNSLEKVPSEAPLKLFSKDEQLAYWLNLYNVTLLDEIMKVYPERRLEDFLYDDEAILEKKILKVNGVKLSLDDIHYNILFNKYNKDPLIMYGLYQGIIGGPNIRRYAYTGKNVWNALESNANDFINSNRGTYADKKNIVRASTLYKRNKIYFPNFKPDLKKHLLKYLEGYTRFALEDAKKVKVNISDWKITDIYGTTRTYGGSVNTSSAALNDSVSNPYESQGGGEGSGGGRGVANLALASSYMAQKSISFGRFTPEQAEKLHKLNKMREVQAGSVTVTDIEQSEDEKN